MTTVRYHDDKANKILHVNFEAPLSVKNMIWGTGVSNAEALLYYQHWCSPSGGTGVVAAGTGATNNCNHHDGGLEDFKGELVGFKKMVDSESIKIDSAAFKLIDT